MTDQGPGEQMEPQDTITIAPSVLVTIVQHAAEQTEGIAGMSPLPVDVGRVLRGSAVGDGVVLDIDGHNVRAELYLVVKDGVNMSKTSENVQAAVTRSVRELIGMTVTSVNIHIEDVDFSS